MLVNEHVQALLHKFNIPIGSGISIKRFVYSFLIFGRTITLIDSGVAGCEKAIFDTIAVSGRDPSEISLIVQTHAHPDHIGATSAIHNSTDCEVAIHSADKAWIEDVSRQNRERPVPAFDSLVGGSVKVSNVLKDGDVITLEGEDPLDLRVFHTPGHSAGSVSLFLKKEGVLFSGDAIPIPGALPVYDDVLASVQSIKRLERIRNISVLLPSWDEPQRGIRVYQRMDEGLHFIQRIHEAFLTAAEEGNTDNEAFCKKVAGELQLPQQVVTPMLARSLASHLSYRNRRNILTD